LIFVIGILNLFCNFNFEFYHLSYAQDIKYPNAAGAFYPDNPGELSQMIDNFLALANPEPLNGEAFLLIQPHAGYGYSGSTAAFGYKLIKDKPYKTVIIIGRSHRYNFSGVSIYPQGKFRIPLGDIEIDNVFTQKLFNQSREAAFKPEVFSGGEHTVEAQLPFLQKVLKEFKIAPIIVGDMTLSDCQKLAELLKNAIGGSKDILVIASTDMYHGGDYQALEATDNLTISYLKNMDSEGLYWGLREEKLQLCGGFAVVTALILAKELGHKKSQVLKHTNSAEVIGAKSNWMVGYLSCAIDGSALLTINPERSRSIEQSPLEPVGKQKEDMRSLTGQERKEASMLNKVQRKRLLEIARKSIAIYLSTGKKMELAETDPALLKEMGAFATLHKHGQLRGCIGNIVAKQPLYLAVRDMAVEAAVDDPRFSQVDLPELKDIEIEISVLSPLERIGSVEKIQMGAHGVIVKKGFNSGVFLPQVATETGWSKEEFLSKLCAQKCGLAPDAWKDKSTELYIFTAEVFSENSY
jgi:MEMO1 family protein